MKSLIAMVSIVLIILFGQACKKDSLNETGTLADPEQFELEVSANPTFTYSYDENKYVGASSTGNNTDDFDTYLDLIPGARQSNNMTIYLYPPPRHAREGDVIGIHIKSEKINPWTFDRNYNATYIAQIPYTAEYAQVNYWDDESSIDFLSQNRPENMSKQVKLKRIGNLLHGEIMNMTLVNHNGSKALTINKLRFQVRPSDNPLID